MAPGPSRRSVTLFLTGDVMLGRGVDQAFARSCLPHLHESFVSSALGYVELAERAHGPIPVPVDHAYVWGDALAELDRVGPDARIINLETSITNSEEYEPKGIHYRMHPANVGALTAASIDCAVLANNHVLDWGRQGLIETLESLTEAGISPVGAGRDLRAARAPVALDLPGGGRILVIAFGLADSGVDPAWAAGPRRAGVSFLPDPSERSAAVAAEIVGRTRREGDVVVASLHWGGNWGYRIPAAHRRFARLLIDRAGVDVVHGHSSHHPRALEVHHGHLILYGCGDFLNDYEGISGYEDYRDDLVVMYLPELELRTGRLLDLAMTPLRIRRFRLERPPPADREWLCRTLDRECRRFGGAVSPTDNGRLRLSWDGGTAGPAPPPSVPGP